MSRRYDLPRKARLNDEAAIARLRLARVVRRGRWFIVRWCENPAGIARLLLRVAKRVARRAVERSRLRRHVREAFRSLKPVIAPGDYFVSVRSNPQPPELPQARRELVQLLHPIR